MNFARLREVAAVAAVIVVSFCTSRAAGQPCTPQWWDASQALRPVIYDLVVPHVFAEFDSDGSGPLARHLYVAGFFTFDAGGLATTGIGRWDGFEWTHVGYGVGTGGLDFVFTLTSFDPDGGGAGNARLIAGGYFGSAGFVAAPNLAQWNGAAWSPLGTGVNPNTIVYSVESFDGDGAGPRPPSLLVAGTSGSRLGDGRTFHSVARWDGMAWHTDMEMPQTYSRCLALKAVDPDGAGPEAPLVFAWVPSTENDNRIERWTGAGWVSTGLILRHTISPLEDTRTPCVMWDPDGAGPQPETPCVSDRDGVRRWINGGWQMIPHSAGGGSLLAVVDEDGSGPAGSTLFTVARHAEGSVTVNSTCRFTGASWVPIGRTSGPPPSGTHGQVFCLQGFDPDGFGPRPGSLFVGGAFGRADFVSAHGLARYGCDESWRTCVGDANGDLRVTFADITDMLTNWGQAGSIQNPAYGDVNGDFVVGMTDIIAALTSFGNDCTQAAAVRPAPPTLGKDLDPRSPMGRLAAKYHQGGFAAVTRALANWPDMD